MDTTRAAILLIALVAGCGSAPTPESAALDATGLVGTWQLVSDAGQIAGPGWLDTRVLGSDGSWSRTVVTPPSTAPLHVWTGTWSLDAGVLTVATPGLTWGTPVEMVECGRALPCLQLDAPAGTQVLARR